MQKRHELTDEQWERIKPLLPPQKPSTGRPAIDHRRILNGILWILKTGAPWRDMPERYGSWRTVYSRFYRWSKNGVWERIFSALQQRIDAEGGMDWDLHLVDGTVVRAHRPAAGAKKGTQRPRPSGEAEGDSAPKSTCGSTPNLLYFRTNELPGAARFLRSPLKQQGFRASYFVR
jgi:transposase